MNEVELRQLYIEEHKSLKEIAKIFNVCPQRVHQRMKQLNIPRRTISDAGRNRHRKITPYHMDDTFWETWTPNLAWFLGLFYADGHIATGRDRAAITAKDIEFLGQIRDMLQSNFRIQTKATTPQLIINSMDRVEMLESFGITRAKTYNMLCPIIPPHLRSHFVRGFFDGDGWVSGTTHRRISVGFEISSKNFADEFASIIQEETNIQASRNVRDRRGDIRTGGHANIHSNHIIYGIRVYCSNAIKFLHWIYQDSTPENRWEYKYLKALPFL